MKVAIITDTHWGARRASKTFQDHFEGFYTKVFFPALKEHGVASVVHMGDAFDSRKNIDIGGLEWTKKVVLDKLKDYSVHLIVGNHDCYYKNTNSVNSPSLLLREYSNIKTYSEITDIKLDNIDITLIPWICSENYESTLDFISKTNSKIAFGHLELTGFVTHPGHVCESGLDPKIFNKYENVYSGHFHSRSSNDKIKYLGNPYEMFWSDCDDSRGFHIFDTETQEMIQIDNPHKLFYKIYYDDTDTKGLNFTQYKDKLVKIIIKQRTDQKKFDKFFEMVYNSGPHEIKVVDNQSFLDNDSFDIEDEENTISLINKYIDEDKNNCNIEKIKLIVEEIYKEACEVYE